MWISDLFTQKGSAAEVSDSDWADNEAPCKEMGVQNDHAEQGWLLGMRQVDPEVLSATALVTSAR